MQTPKRRPRFALEGHRGARGLSPENTLAGFAEALEIGVTTLELDVGVTRDGVVVVGHDRRISPLLGRDTGGGRVVGRLVRDVTYAELETLDCGTRRPDDPATDPFVRTQVPVPGERMPTLAEVFELARVHGADGVQFDIETKIDPTVDDTVGPEALTRAVLDIVEEHGMVERSMLQSFDWRTLVAAGRELPRLRTVAIAAAQTIFPGTPWTAGAAIADDAWSRGTLADAAAAIGCHGISANFPEITDALIDRAHRLGLSIVSGTINDEPTVGALIDRGVDGIVTDYPDRARRAMARKGLRLPPRHAAVREAVS